MKQATLRVGFSAGERSDLGGVLEIVPHVDDMPLTTLVGVFEQDRHYNPADGYGGIVPSLCRFGPLRAHYLGASQKRPGSKVPLLGCECGEWGCWPLLATIRATDEYVQWSEFEQPHRRDRDYSGFGPFVFERNQYEDALSQLASALGPANGR